MSVDVYIGSDSLDAVFGPEGPRGQAAAQDLGWGPLVGLFNASEILDLPPLPRAATFLRLFVHTRTGVTADAAFAINQLRAGATVASVAFTLHAGDRDLALNLAAPGLAGLAGDVFQLVAPSMPDLQLTDLTVSLASA